MACAFCKIVEHKIKSNIVYEDNDILAFLDNRPRGKGHTLVIPKKHCQNIFEISEVEYAKLSKVVQKIAKALQKTFSINDLRILQNNGEGAGQVVEHMHTHIIPILPYENESLEEIANKIRKNVVK